MLTAYFARFLGLWALITSLCMVLNPAPEASMSVLFHDPAAMFVTGLLLVVVGLAIVLAHNVWSGGALPVIVTILGWLTLFKGLHFLLLAPHAQVAFYDWSHYDQYAKVYGGIGIVLGAIITYLGFRAPVSGKN